ncbi:hypothetical protein [Streptomyces koelreuteriae]|uniref:hypothetical protein n=1 Tax=Streptomyces koelreuteriae TaxID=2838015 RepID=UPI003EBFA0E0
MISAVTAPGTHSPDNRPAVERWLLSAHSEPEQARGEWGENGVVLLPLGARFSAVRIPRELVMSAARLEESKDYLVDVMLDEFLGETLNEGPVIFDQHRQRYYMLVPGSTPIRWHKAAASWRTLGVDCLGLDTYLGVPRLNANRGYPEHWSSYWAVPMRSPGALCNVIDVARLIAAGKRNLAEVAE